MAFGLMHTERTGSVATTTVSTGTLRRSKTSMNPKQLAFLASCFRSTPADERSQVQQRDFFTFLRSNRKKTCFPPSRSTKTRHKRFERVAWLCTKSMHDRFRPFKRANGSKRQTFSSENGERDAEFFACREALAGCRGAALTQSQSDSDVYTGLSHFASLRIV